MLRCAFLLARKLPAGVEMTLHLDVVQPLLPTDQKDLLGEGQFLSLLKTSSISHTFTPMAESK